MLDHPDASEGVCDSDLDSQRIGEVEQEADAFALDTLILPEVWERVGHLQFAPELRRAAKQEHITLGGRTLADLDAEIAKFQRKLALGIPHLLMAQRSGKRAYDPRKPQVNILSVQSSKGLEFRSVIFIGLGQIESSET